MHSISRLSLFAVAGMLAAGGAAAQPTTPLTAPPAASAAAASTSSAGAQAPGNDQAQAVRPVVRQVPDPTTPAVSAASGPGVNTPSTAQAASASAATANATAAQAARAPRREEQFGDMTRGLLELQAGGHRAGPGLPLQGPVATAAWKRYMKSFEHDIPQWFGQRVRAGGSGGSGGGGQGR